MPGRIFEKKTALWVYNMIRDIQSWDLNRPIVINEDSHAIGQMEVTYHTRTSWGYYNNMTKQEPPADWSVTKGEDTFFAHRMAEGIGIKLPPIPNSSGNSLQKKNCTGLKNGIKSSTGNPPMPNGLSGVR